MGTPSSAEGEHQFHLLHEDPREESESERESSELTYLTPYLEHQESEKQGIDGDMPIYVLKVQEC